MFWGNPPRKAIVLLTPTLSDDAEAQEILKDLIDDREIEEEEDSDASVSSKKRKKSDEEDEDDDRLEDDDYDLLEENLGVKVQRRKRFKRVRPQIDDDESDGDDKNDNGEMQRERIAERIFDSDDVRINRGGDWLGICFSPAVLLFGSFGEPLVNQLVLFLFRSTITRTYLYKCNKSYDSLSPRLLLP